MTSICRAPINETSATLQPRLQWAGDLANHLRAPVSTLARASGLRGYEHYARDPSIDPELTQRRGQEAMGAIGTPAQVTATLKDLLTRHVTHFLAYMDIGGLPYPRVAQSLCLFAEQVMPHFK